MYCKINTWKIRIGSPRELVWDIKSILEDKGFKITNQPEKLALEPTPISGHATFMTQVRGEKRHSHTNKILFIIGIILCFTIILIPVGIWMIIHAVHDVVKEAVVDIEGETFRATALKQDPYNGQADVVGTASNARITLTGYINCYRSNKKVGEVPKVERQKYWDSLEKFGDKLELLLPTLEIPKTSEQE